MGQVELGRASATSRFSVTCAGEHREVVSFHFPLISVPDDEIAVLRADPMGVEPYVAHEEEADRQPRE